MAKRLTSPWDFCLHCMNIIVNITIIITTFFVVTVAHAERVLVQAANEEKGQAWLFSSLGNSPGECWLAVPRHVVDGVDGKPTAFTFTDMSGLSGESAIPLFIKNVPGALEATGNVEDLAFARVAVGRKKGECLSHLGLPSYSYDAIMRTSPKLILFSLLPTSFGVFEAKIVRAGTETRGGLVNIQPINRAHVEKYTKKGISGSVAEVMRGEETYPFGMVTEVNPSQGTMRAIRFDLIREAFNKVEEFDVSHLRHNREQTTGIPFQIVAFDALSLNPSTGPTSLHDKEKCWNIMPRGGQQSITITIELSDPKDRVSRIILTQKKGCGDAPLKFYIDQRVPGLTSWSRVGSCETTTQDRNNSTCRLDLSGPRQLRISINNLKSTGLSCLYLL